MRIHRLAYHLSVMAVASLALLVFQKIDKISFYHHYFKVIEEVEVRNSQALDAAYLTFRLSAEHHSNSLPLWLMLGVLGSGLGSLLIPFQAFQAAQQPVLQPTDCSVRLPFIRAP